MRFPEFSGEWEVKRLGDDCEIQMCKRVFANQTSEIGEVPFYKIGTIGAEADAFISQELYEEYRSKYNYPRHGEVLITCAGTVGKTITYKGEDAYYQDSNIVWISNPKQYYVNSFLQRVLSRIDWSKLNTTTIVRIYNDNLRDIVVFYPSKKEQDKITNLFSLIDDRIQTQIGAIGKIESLITGITSKVSHSNNVKKMYLKDLLMERTERNVGHHEVYSVSVSEGVVNQVEYLGRSFAAAETSHYSVARYGDIIYTKSPTGSFPYGIVKRSAIPDPVAVSPLYGVYQPINENIGIYLHQYFCNTINAHNYLHRLIQKGAKNTINITNQRFLENTVPIPDEVTLEKYVKVIDSLTQKLKNEKCLLESYRRQKFYLLKNMFV